MKPDIYDLDAESGPSEAAAEHLADPVTGCRALLVWLALCGAVAIVVAAHVGMVGPWLGVGVSGVLLVAAMLLWGRTWR
jgi:hypothetical protein